MRRVILRIVTSLMNLIIGPSGAWYALGLKGLCVYIVLMAFTKFLVAESFSINEKVSKIGYRLSPIFLLLAGSLPLIVNDWYVYVIIIPILLGTYIGTFWTAFHGIRKLRNSSSERKSVRWFQYYEIMSTITAAFIVLSLKYVELTHYAGYLGALLALLALIIPMNIGEGKIGISTNDFSNEKVILAKLTTGSFGIIGFSLVWCMRVIALQYAGISGTEQVKGKIILYKMENIHTTSSPDSSTAKSKQYKPNKKSFIEITTEDLNLKPVGETLVD